MGFGISKLAKTAVFAAALFKVSDAAFNVGSFDFAKYMKIQSMKSQFNKDYLHKDQQSSLFSIAGFSDMELFMSKHLSADELKQSMKQEMKDKMLADILNGGGIDISNPIWRKKFFKDKDNAELFTESMQEPLQSIIRLSRDPNPSNKEYGKRLMKKVQYKQFNREGNYITENLDEILLADSKQDKIKELLKRQMLQTIEDPIDRAIMHNLQQQQSTKDSSEKYKLRADMKDLQTIKLFQNSVPKVSPVSPDDLYAFHTLTNTDDPNEAEILSLALGEPLKGISELDFERYFGTPAKQFSCRAHPDRLRVPCGINPSADQCLASGCCYIPKAGSSVPSCYHDLYGKIGSSFLRNEFVQTSEEITDHIKSLFRGKNMPTLSNLLKEDYGKYVVGMPSLPSQTNWWDAAKLTGEDGNEVHLLNQQPEQVKYGRPGFEWKPHGPTASPYIVANPDVNPTAAPGGGGGLDGYYKMWLSYSDTQNQADCALINKNSRVKCMDNFDALKDHNLNIANPEQSSCKQAGCCFNEDSFLGGSHACYRASDYGTCSNLPTGFEKRECGYDGITEGDCLTNLKCCYASDNSGSPWCFYKYSATLEEDEWCTAWNLNEHRTKPRQMCWDTTTSSNDLFADGTNTLSNINNIVSQEQCLAEGCCYDENLTKDALDWLINGIGQGDGLYRCFKKTNPALIWANDPKNYQVNKEINNSKDGDGNDLADQSTYSVSSTPKTCDTKLWDSGTLKKSCGENLSYNQCVYEKRCCYKPTVTNEPTCFEAN